MVNVWVLAVQPVKRDVAALVTSGHAVGFASHLAALTGAVPALRLANGRLLLPHRLLDWAAAACSLVCVLASLAPPSLARRPRLTRTLLAALLALPAVAVEHVLPLPARCGVVALGLAAFAEAVVGQAGLLRLAAASVAAEDAAPLGVLRRVTLLLWLCFPAVRVAADLRRLSSAGEEVALCALDVLIAAYSLFQMVVAFEHADNARHALSEARAATPVNPRRLRGAAFGGSGSCGSGADDGMDRARLFEAGEDGASLHRTAVDDIVQDLHRAGRTLLYAVGLGARPATHAAEKE